MFSQSYVKHDLRKNKIIVVSTTGFLGINTKFEGLTPICEALIPKLRH
jgi:hypothetical protein